MIRPCDDCDGSGISPTIGRPRHSGQLMGHEKRCSRCADMPQLPARYAAQWAELIKPKREAMNILEPLPDWYQRDEPFHPDPTTVMRWCVTHQVPSSQAIDKPYCGVAMIDTRPCEIVWVERPMPLAEVDQ